MGYDRGDSFSFNFEPNGIPFGSKSNGKLSPRSYPIQVERNWEYSCVSVPGPGTRTSVHVSKFMYITVFCIVFVYSSILGGR